MLTAEGYIFTGVHNKPLEHRASRKAEYFGSLLVRSNIGN